MTRRVVRANGELAALELRKLVLITLLALIARVVCAFWWQSQLNDPHAFRFGDSHTYWILGKQIAYGNDYYFGDYRSSIFRAPGYPILLSGVFGLRGTECPTIEGRILGAILGAGCVTLLMLFAKPLVGTRAALASGLIAALYPGLIVTSILILSESPFCLAMMGHLLLWAQADRATGIRQWALYLLAGIVAGMGILIRPSWLLFIPFAAIVSLISFRPRKTELKHATILLLGVCITMAPWWIRNYQITGHWVPTTLQVGASLYDGISPIADGSSNMEFVPGFRKAQVLEDTRTAPEQLESTFEFRLDRRIKRAAIEWGAKNPGKVLQLAPKKFVRMWNPFPNNDELNSWKGRAVVGASFVIVLGLAMMGIWLLWRQKRTLLYCLTPVLYFSLLHVIFVSSIRYRQPCMLLLTVLAGTAMVHALDSLRTMRSSN